ncbi:replication initiation protein [Actinomadura nitritigenes]|uniref:Replication initiation protein n=2 Tax=Actinomadura nitritigenes TaxID=134602 RepID=A0ABS3RGU1_9ACTN|nr:replication initiator [Actinomadura nitritigenes]MBO2445431.1 replication initiation protein [Actinomadura nitritigenes]
MVKTLPPLAREVLQAVAIEHGVCIRPVPMRRVNLTTGESEVVYVPCNHTLASVCPPCAERKRKLRAVQCNQGWHLAEEPVITRADPDEQQRSLMELRARAQTERDHAAETGSSHGEGVEFWDGLLRELDVEIERSGVRGALKTGEDAKGRRTRSTRRRQDAPDLPRRPVDSRTVGKVFRGRDGKTFRPSIFLTLTLDSYGRVRSDGTPVDPATYDYKRAARDALHFSKLVDRFVQNLRRFVGYDVQYFATVEPQRRLAPHLHMAIRGTISRAELRQVVAATYHQVWWPSTDRVVYSGDRLPVWDDAAGENGGYLDPTTGEVLPTWDDALDAIGLDDDAEPLHVMRFGRQIDAQGVMADSDQSRRLIGYLTKYLVKGVAECHEAGTEAQREHVDRMAETLRFEPCSPTCANWLRYGVQPKNARRGMTPGFCKGKAHRREHLGYGGRRVLVSRKWSGKTLADHKADRKAWVLARLAEAGIPVLNPADPNAVHVWERAGPGDPDVKPTEQRLMHMINERVTRRAQLDQATQNDTPELSATREAA